MMIINTVLITDNHHQIRFLKVVNYGISVIKTFHSAVLLQADVCLAHGQTFFFLIFFTSIGRLTTSR